MAMTILTTFYRGILTARDVITEAFEARAHYYRTHPGATISE